MTQERRQIHALERELIVVMKPDVALHATRTALFSETGADTSALASLLQGVNASMRPLFSSEEHFLRSLNGAGAPAIGLPELAKFHKVEAKDEQLDELAQKLRVVDVVENAYVKPPTT